MPSVLWRCWLGGRKGIQPVKTEWWGAGVVICLQRGADLHMAQLMPLPITVSFFSKIQIGFTCLVPAHLGSPEKGPWNVCVCVVNKISIYLPVVWRRFRWPPSRGSSGCSVNSPSVCPATAPLSSHRSQSERPKAAVDWSSRRRRRRRCCCCWYWCWASCDAAQLLQRHSWSLYSNDKQHRARWLLFSLAPRLSTWHCPHLLQSDGGRLLSIDISCPRGAQQQTRRTQLLLSIDGTDKQTDRRTVARPFYKLCSSYCAVTVKGILKIIRPNDIWS